MKYIRTYKECKKYSKECKNSKLEILLGFTHSGGWFNCLIGR